MKIYRVLCKTCGGTGYAPIPHQGYTTSNIEVCLVCNGSKTQVIYETEANDEGLEYNLKFEDCIHGLA